MKNTLKNFQIVSSSDLQYPGDSTKPPTEEPTNGPTNEPPEDKEVCRANPEASNADLCGSMEWACYGHNYVDMKV